MDASHPENHQAKQPGDRFLAVFEAWCLSFNEKISVLESRHEEHVRRICSIEKRPDAVEALFPND